MHQRQLPPYAHPAYRTLTTTPFNAQSRTPATTTQTPATQTGNKHPPLQVQGHGRQNVFPKQHVERVIPRNLRPRPKKSSRRGDIETKDLPREIVSYDGVDVYVRTDTAIGEGAFSKCYLVQNKNTGEMGAGKFFTRGASSSHKKLERFEREVSIMRALKHPNIVRIFSAISGVKGGRALNTFRENEHVSFRHAPLMVMEYCSGGSVSSYMKARRPHHLYPDQKYGILSPLETLWVAECCAKALSYITTFRLVHRDVKMGNLLLQTKASSSRNGLLDVGIVLCDFGLATQLSHDGDRAKGTAGTPNYMAPEVVSRKGACYASDIWSLGVTLFHCLTGRCPFPAESVEETYQRIEDNNYHWRSHEKDNVSSKMRKLVDSIMRTRPEDRLTADELLKQVETLKQYYEEQESETQ